MNPDGSIAHVTQSETAGWAETINGQYKAGDGSVRDFTMTLSPTVEVQRQNPEDDQSRVIGYRVTLADIADFDPSVKEAMTNWQTLNRAFTAKAAVAAAPAAGAAPRLVASQTTEVAVPAIS